MYLSQASALDSVHVLGIADLSRDRAADSLRRLGWPPEQFAARSASEARRTNTTYLTDDAEALIDDGQLDIVVEATGVPSAAIAHALQAFDNGCSVIMVTVEADALAGPLLARKAHEAGVVYSLAYGDQPALICELVEWARTCGFVVVCAGKGTKYLPKYHRSTPDTVWEYYGLTAQMVSEGGLNPRLFNSFVDGTKSAIEMAAVANATGLVPQPDGLHFQPCGIDSLARVLRPVSDGGQLSRKGTVEVISSLERSGHPVRRDLRWGVFVILEAPTDYVRHCFQEYGLLTDKSGRYAAMYRSHHLIGLELGVSIARVGFHGEPTGAPRRFHADVCAVAKRDLPSGTTLDGEGGFCAYGTLMPAELSLDRGALPIGLAQGVRVQKPVRAGDVITWEDVNVDEGMPLVRFRREMEREFATEGIATDVSAVGGSHLGPPGSVPRG